MFGYDLAKLYIRLRGISPMRELMQKKSLSILFHVTAPVDLSIRFSLDKDGNITASSASLEQSLGQVESALETVLEFSLPLCLLGIDGSKGANGDVVEFYTVIERKGRETERFPHTENVTMAYRGKKLDLENWHV